MPEITGLTVLIDGDISGITKALNEAKAEIDAFSSYTAVGYAGGDYTTAKKRYNYWADSGHINTNEKISWWRDAMDYFAYDETAQWEARKEIFALQQQNISDINKLAERLVEFNDYYSGTESGSTDAINMFNSVKELNKSNARAGILTWMEYFDNVSELGTKMYEGRIKNSEEWLRREEKYNGLSVDDYVKGLERMKEYTAQYCSEGLISYKEYIQGIEYLDDKIADKHAEEYARWKNDAAVWKSDRDLYGDWAEKGDSTVGFFSRYKNKTKEFYNAGKISWDTMNEEIQAADRELFKIQSAGDEVYSKWKNDADGWKNLRDTYGDWEKYGDSIVQFYNRCIEKVAQLYKEGHISWQKYSDETMNYEMKLFEAESVSMDNILAQMSEHIKNKQKLFKDEEQSLKDSWSVSDRDDRLYELKGELAVYKNAVTEKGKDKYRSLLDEQKKLRREEELYNLQQKNNAVLEKLQAQYDAAEKNKDNILNKITSTNNDLKNIADDFNIDFSQFGKKTEQLLEQLIYEVRSAASKANTNTYNDSRKISINTAVSGTLLDRYINGRSAGLAGVIYNGRVR